MQLRIIYFLLAISVQSHSLITSAAATNITGDATISGHTLYILNPEVKYGDLLTSFSIIIAALIFIYGRKKDREMKNRDYANKIRDAAATTMAKLERWKELTLRFFEDIQPIFTEVDMSIVRNKDAVSARDNLWFGLVKAYANSSQKIVDEEIEIAYKGLYGYDSRVQNLFAETLHELKFLSEGIRDKLIILTNEDVLNCPRKSYGIECVEQPIQYEIKSGQLGNELRTTAYLCRLESTTFMDGILSIFRDEMMKILNEDDDTKIIDRKIDISNGLNEPSWIKSGFDAWRLFNEEKFEKSNKDKKNENYEKALRKYEDAIENEYYDAIKNKYDDADPKMKGFLAGKCLLYKALGKEEEMKSILEKIKEKVMPSYGIQIDCK